MLCDVVRRRRRRCWAHALVIHAASHFDQKKRVAWVPISMHTCGSFFYNYGAPLGGPSGPRSSAINSALLLVTMRDRASVNDVAIRTVIIPYPNLVDIGCFSYTLDHVGEKMETPILDQFLKAWVSLFAHSPKSRTAFKTQT